MSDNVAPLRKFGKTRRISTCKSEKYICFMLMRLLNLKSIKIKIQAKHTTLPNQDPSQMYILLSVASQTLSYNVHPFIFSAHEMKKDWQMLDIPSVSYYRGTGEKRHVLYPTSSAALNFKDYINQRFIWAGQQKYAFQFCLLFSKSRFTWTVL